MSVSEQERLALRESILGYDPFLVEEESEEEETSEEEYSDEEEVPSDEEESSEESEEESEEEAPAEQQESVLPVWKRKNFAFESVKQTHDYMNEIKAKTPLAKSGADKKILAEAQATQEVLQENDGTIRIPKGKYQVL